MKPCFATPIVLVLVAGLVFGEDCNQNGAEDAVDLSGGASADCNRNGIPDDCERGPGLPFGYAESGSIPDVPATALHPLDIDGDGDLDIAAAGFQGIDIIEYEGEALKPIQHLDPPPGSFATNGRLADVDLDLDGDLDLVAAFDGSVGGLFLLRNQGDGAFEDPTFLHAVDNPFYVVAAELDGDGTPDLLTNKSTEGFILVSGASGEGVTLLPTNLFGYAAADAGRLDADGDNDIVFAGRLDDVAGLFTLENLGAGSFGEPVNILRSYPGSVQLIDTDGDGDLDAASDQGFSSNDGTGSFTETVNFEGDGGTPVDVDGDGDLDLLRIRVRVEEDHAYEGFNGISIRLNTGDDVFDPRVAFPTGAQRPDDVTFLDLNIDGRPDFLLAAGALTSFLNDGQPYLQSDADRNGVLDVCELFYRGDVNSSGDINITDPIRLLNYLFMGDARELACLDATDANNDGEVDISDGILLLFYSFGTGRPPAPPGPDCGKDPEGGDLGCTSYTGCADFGS